MEHDDRLSRLIARQVGLGRTVCFAPAPAFPQWIDMTLTAADGTEVSEASCRSDEIDVRAVLRRLVLQLEGD